MSVENRSDALMAVVPVRAGSKGLPGKNVRLLAGLPLYMHAVHQGLRTTGRVLLSTNIPEIAQSDLPEGCILCPRSAHLSADNTPMASVIADLIETRALERHTLVLLQATSPLRIDSDINAAISLHAEGRHDLVMSVVVQDRGVLKFGTLSSSGFTPLRDPTFCFTNRQSLPPIYGPNGAVYVFSAKRFIMEGGFPSASIGAVEMPAERSVDIDTIEDFRAIEKMIDENRLPLGNVSLRGEGVGGPLEKKI